MVGGHISASPDLGWTVGLERPFGGLSFEEVVVVGFDFYQVALRMSIFL